MSNPILSVQEIKALDTFIDAFNDLDTLLETTKVNKKVADALSELKKAFLVVRESSYRKALIDLLVASGVDLEADADYSDTDLLLLAHTTTMGAVGVVTQTHRVTEESGDDSTSDTDTDEEQITLPVTESDEDVQQDAKDEPIEEKEEVSGQTQEDDDELDIFLPAKDEESQSKTPEVESASEQEGKDSEGADTQDQAITEEDSIVSIDQDSAQVLEDEDEKVEEHSHSQDASIDESAHRPMFEAREGEDDEQSSNKDETPATGEQVFVTAPVTAAPPVTQPVDNFFARLSTAPSLPAPAAAKTVDYSPGL